jgi:hypothetical protein
VYNKFNANLAVQKVYRSIGLFYKLNAMKRIVTIVMLLVSNLLYAQQKKPKPLYRFSFAFNAFRSIEPIKVIDPQGQLSRNSLTFGAVGASFAYHHNERTRFLLNYQRDPLGTYAFFSTPIGLQIASNRVAYNRFALMGEKDLFPTPMLKKIQVFARAGVSYSFTGSPNTSGVYTAAAADSAGNILAFINDSFYINRPSYFSVGGAIGLRYQLSKRWFVAANVTRFWNISSSAITGNAVNYKLPNNPNIYNAQITTNGNVINYQFSLGYNLGKRKDTAAERRLKARGVKWPERRFAVMITGSDVFPTIKVNDPAGYLSRSSGHETHFGVLLRYQIKNKWHISLGVEGLPNAVDARLRGQAGPSGAAIAPAIQVPLHAEYNVLSLRKKVKLDIFLRSGIIFGVQPFPGNLPVTHLNPIDRIDSIPGFYQERESKILVNKSYWAFNTGIQGYLHINKDIFLTGYVNRQLALGNRPFIQSEVLYKVAANQQEWYKATLHSTGSAWMIGWGLGFRF